MEMYFGVGGELLTPLNEMLDCDIKYSLDLDLELKDSLNHSYNSGGDWEDWRRLSRSPSLDLFGDRDCIMVSPEAVMPFIKREIKQEPVSPPQTPEPNISEERSDEEVVEEEEEEEEEEAPPTFGIKLCGGYYLEIQDDPSEDDTLNTERIVERTEEVVEEEVEEEDSESDEEDEDEEESEDEEDDEEEQEQVKVVPKDAMLWKNLIMKPAVKAESPVLSNLVRQKMENPLHSNAVRQKADSPALSSLLRQKAESSVHGNLLRHKTNSPVHSSLMRQKADSPVHSSLVRQKADSPVHSSLLRQKADSPVHSSLLRQKADSPVHNSLVRQKTELAVKSPSTSSAQPTIKVLHAQKKSPSEYSPTTVNSTPKRGKDMSIGYPKPAYSYSCLIAMALKNSVTGSLPVSEIYNFMCEHFPYFESAPTGWKNSVRHNLSLNKCFEKIEKVGSTTGCRKGCLWAMNPAKIAKMDDEVAKWSKKDPAAIRRSMKYPEELERLERGELKIGLMRDSDDSEDDDDDDSDSSDSESEEESESEPEQVPPSLKRFDSRLSSIESNQSNDLDLPDEMYQELGLLEEVISSDVEPESRPEVKRMRLGMEPYVRQIVRPV